VTDTTEVRVRIAPSPTGMPHVGLYHTFLYNWLFARRHGGKFIIRIEDTDVERSVPGAVEALLDGIRWLGLDWDEGPVVGGPYGPYVQSQRLPIYREHAERLIAEGKAYRCYCTPERLEALRAEQRARGEPPGYDRWCRWLSPAEREVYERQGLPFVIRFAVPTEGTTTFHDLLRGDITWENALIRDFVILKSDGYPTYHLAHLVDDHLMRISHVLRGEEWISTTPWHILLYEAFGWTPPKFAHLPPVLGPDRKKLSKRHGAEPIASYREAGYLPEALVNFLGILGCSFDPTGQREIFSLQEMIEAFELERVSRTGGIFDREKLDWMNGYYIRQMSVEDLACRLMPFLEAAGLVTDADEPYVRRVVPLVQERLKRLGEAPELTDFFFREPEGYDAYLLVPKGMTVETSGEALLAARDLASRVEPFEHAALESAFRTKAEEIGVKTGPFFMTVRVALTGRTVAPPLFQTMEVLGRERVLRRLDAAVERIKGLLER